MIKFSARLAVGLAAVLMAGACLAAGTPATAPDSPAGPRAVVEGVTRQVIAALRDGKLTREEKFDKVKELAFDNMDFETLARLSMAQAWRGLSEEQRAQFLEEFKKHITATYGHTTDDYTDEDINIAADHEEPRGDWTVETRVVGTRDGVRKEVAKLDYRMRKADGRWKVIDVTIDGVSMVANFRAQFQDIMGNGGFDRLMKLLREKDAQAQKK